MTSEKDFVTEKKTVDMKNDYTPNISLCYDPSPHKYRYIYVYTYTTHHNTPHTKVRRTPSSEVRKFSIPVFSFIANGSFKKLSNLSVKPIKVNGGHD